MANWLIRNLIPEVTMKRRPIDFHRTLILAALAVGLGAGTVDAVAADAALPEAHSDSMGAAVSDTVLTARVKTHLLGKRMLRHSDIDVTTTNGVVTLNGSASGPKAMAFAVDTAKAVEGVKSVDNNLTVASRSDTSAKIHKAADTTSRVISDSWITTKLKSELLADSVSKGADVSVETTHGVVVLKGVLPNQASVDHVKVMAEQVSGVKSVDVSGLTVAAS